MPTDNCTPLQFRPGCAAPTFKRRCAEPMYEELLEEFGEYEAYICGQRVLLHFSEDGDKFRLGGDGMEVEGEVLRIVWLKSSAPNVRSGSPVVIDGKRYEIKKGFPVVRKRCLLMAELKCCETCL